MAPKEGKKAHQVMGDLRINTTEILTPNQKKDKARKSNGKFDRIDIIDKEMDNTQDESTEEGLELMNQHTNTIESSLVTPIAAYHPNLGVVSGFSDLNEGAGKIIPQADSPRELQADHSTFVVHGREGPYLMEKNRWPKLLLPNESESQEGEPVEVLTQDDSVVHLPNPQDAFTLHSGSKLGTLHENPIVNSRSSIDDKRKLGETDTIEGEDLMDTFSIQSKD